MSQGRPLIKWPLPGCDLISLRRPDAWFNCSSTAERRGVEKSRDEWSRVRAVTQVTIRSIKCCGYNFPMDDSWLPTSTLPLRAVLELALLTRLTCCSPHLQAHSVLVGLSPPGWMRDARSRAEVIHFSSRVPPWRLPAFGLALVSRHAQCCTQTAHISAVCFDSPDTWIPHLLTLCLLHDKKNK